MRVLILNGSPRAEGNTSIAIDELVKTFTAEGGMPYKDEKFIRKQVAYMIIETQRLILRPFTESDAADVLEYLKEPEVNCFASMKLNSLDEARAEMKKRCGETEYYFAITLKDTGKVIGEIDSYPETGEQLPDENYPKDTFFPCWMLNKEYQDKGYAYEAAHAFFDYLFREKGARRIYAYTDDYNKSSQHLCEKLGMRREGLFVEFVSFVNNPDGTPHYENTYQYAILKKEWDNSEGGISN